MMRAPHHQILGSAVNWADACHPSFIARYLVTSLSVVLLGMHDTYIQGLQAGSVQVFCRLIGSHNIFRIAPPAPTKKPSSHHKHNHTYGAQLSAALWEHGDKFIYIYICEYLFISCLIYIYIYTLIIIFICVSVCIFT